MLRNQVQSLTASWVVVRSLDQRSGVLRACDQRQTVPPYLPWVGALVATCSLQSTWFLPEDATAVPIPPQARTADMWIRNVDCCGRCCPVCSSPPQPQPLSASLPRYTAVPRCGQTNLTFSLPPLLRNAAVCLSCFFAAAGAKERIRHVPPSVAERQC